MCQGQKTRRGMEKNGKEEEEEEEKEEEDEEGREEGRGKKERERKGKAPSQPTHSRLLGMRGHKFSSLLEDHWQLIFSWKRRHILFSYLAPEADQAPVNKL